MMEGGPTSPAAPLTPVQLGMFFQALSSPGSGVDIEQIVGDLREVVDVDRLRDAFRRAVVAEPRFRTTVVPDAATGAKQVVLDHAPELEWHADDLTTLDAIDRERHVAAYLERDRARGFDLSVAPLSRVALFRFEPDHIRLVWTVHHILMDGWSFPLILRRVFAAPQAGTTATPPPGPDFVSHLPRLLHRDAPADETFWRQHVGNAQDVVSLAPENTSVGAPEISVLHASLDRVRTRQLKEQASALGIRPSTLFLGAWSLVMSAHTGQRDVLFGVTTAGRTRQVDDEVVGVFINTLPMRVTVNGETRLDDWLRTIRQKQQERRPHERTPLADIQRWSGLPAGRALFDTLVVFDDASLNRMLADDDAGWARRRFALIERTGYPITVYGRTDDALTVEMVVDTARVPAQVAHDLVAHLEEALNQLASPDMGRVVATVDVLGAQARSVLLALGQGPVHPVPDRCIHELVIDACRRHPERAALIFRGRQISYGVLHERVEYLAHVLVAHGVVADQPVGLSVSRSMEMVVGMLGILRAGGAYVPIDPDYPADRRTLMLEDSGAHVLVADHEWAAHRGVTLRIDRPLERTDDDVDLDRRATPHNLAYVIYTSGSTGRPKGVMVEHRNVVNFFEGMDRVLSPDLASADGPGTWLAVTSPSFDISVLEIVYTLTRGFTVVVAADDDRLAGSADRRGMAMSLFYFASDESGRDKYRLLLEGARFADTHDFEAVWTPERHFHAFGGLYPNPSVAAAALAAVTSRVGIRAGSVVVPLHDPLRIAEEWSMVDNLSGGRVGISVASGWHPDDFVFAPDTHARRKVEMLERLDVVKRLWRGESIERVAPGGRAVQIRTLPRPVQQELPVWMTAAGNPDTFRIAGERGLNVLTHLLGQTLETVAANLAVYRDAWRQAGHEGRGHVTLMLHTFVGDSPETVRDAVREPMKSYLRSSVDLVKGFAHEWSAYARGAQAPASDVLDAMSADDMDALLDYAFERFYDSSALFGTADQCAAFVRTLEGIGVDEVACLIDFGVDVDTTLAHLEHLNRVRVSTAPAAAAEDFSIPSLIRRHGVTHLQCTPSMARGLMASASSTAALETVPVVMVGGEALPPDLATAIRSRSGGRLINMYGPTETTIWSSTHDVQEAGSIPIGRPISNTSLQVRHPNGPLAPRGVAGELYIGGAGVVRGYHERDDLTRERFVVDPTPGDTGARLYRTGDLTRWRDDGTLEFLGRLDHQVKVRGHRIELGEIESTIAQLAGVHQCVVVAREDRPGDQRLVAYVVRTAGEAELDAAAVKAHTASVLPAYMVPQHVMFIEAFPQTPNRKVDRKALPAPGEAADTSRPYVPPTTQLEQDISGIWRDVLGTERVGLQDNFFDLGGHSILAVQVHARLQELTGRALPITDLFRFPTVATLAAHLGGRSADQPPAAGSAADRGRARRAMLARRRGE